MSLRQAPELWVDTEQFQRLLAACQQHGHPPTEVCPTCQDLLSEAVALARGEFMAGFTLPDSPDFDDWQRYEREGLRRELAGALERLARLMGRNAEKNIEQAIAYARRWLSLDPLHEPAHRLLMQLYAQCGQRQAAFQQYHECARVLEADLGVAPSEETTILHERIRSGALVPAPERTPPIAAKAPAHNLPVSPTPFIGRQEEQGEIFSRLAGTGCRLLTVIGPGGMGKTRLAIEAARQLAEQGAFADGAYMVGLAPVSSPSFLLTSIMEALSFQQQGSAEPLSQLLDFLRAKEMLLVLDNLEHLLEGTDLLVQILDSSPGIKLLVTSRERLALRAETVFPLEGLSFPPSVKEVDVEQWSAVQLFVHSAQRVERTFQLTEESAPWVTRICQLVQGMPLAIELAAAWVRALPHKEIAQEIVQDLDFLSSAMRDVPERHRSVRAVFEHSWRMLSEEERRVYRKLAVFRGGFRREGAQQVAGASPPILSSLVDKSFLRCGPGGRYGRHTLLWQYANEKLTQSPEERSRAQAAHGEYYAAFLARRETRLQGREQKETLEQLGAELENVRVAWQWMVAQGQSTLLDHALKALADFYAYTGLLQEGEAMMARALDHFEVAAPEKDVTRLLARLRAEQARFLTRQARYEEGIAAAQAAIEHAHATQDAESEGAALLRWGQALVYIGQYQPALERLQQALALARSARSRPAEAGALLTLGLAHYHRGDYAQTRSHFERALQLYRGMGNRRGEGVVLSELAGLLQYEGNYAEAKPYSEQALAIAEELGNLPTVGEALLDLGNIAVDQGYCLEARARYEQALAIFRQVGERRGESIVLVNLGLTSIFLGDYTRAKQILDTVLELTRATGDRRIEGIVLLNLSHLARHLGQDKLTQDYLAQAWEIQSAIKNRRSEALVRAYLGLFAYHQGEYETALAHCEQSIAVAREHGDRHIEAYSLNHLGHTLLAMRQPEEAITAYEAALALRRDLGQLPLAMEVLAGLARAALVQEDLPRARQVVETILVFLEGRRLDGSDEPLRIYLTCYRVLKAVEDARAQVILGAAYQLSQEQATRISDSVLQRSFLENVPAHREIVVAWQALKS
ncbi:MAG: tetratricopeptide repeat protein [Geodermatophilaceae bacterium]|nr:tetratricopeptide repeat protein [Geodermatophilaceae bacterium]